MMGIIIECESVDELRVVIDKLRGITEPSSKSYRCGECGTTQSVSVICPFCGGSAKEV